MPAHYQPAMPLLTIYAHRDERPETWVTKKNLEARVGFEPTNGGFADLSLGPLGYRAELLSIAKLAQTPGVAANGQNCERSQFKPKQALCVSRSGATIPRATSGRVIFVYLFFVHQGQIDFCFAQET